MSWDELGYFDKVEWTQAFLDYPPVFVGVIGMLGTSEQVQHLKPTTFTSWVTEASMLVDNGFDPCMYQLLMLALHDRNRRSPLSRQQIDRIFVLDADAQSQITGTPDRPATLPRRLKPKIVKLIARSYACRIRFSVIIDTLLDRGIAPLRTRTVLLESNRDEYLENYYLNLNTALHRSLAQRRKIQQDNLES